MCGTNINAKAHGSYMMPYIIIIINFDHSCTCRYMQFVCGSVMIVHGTAASYCVLSMNS